MFNDPFLGLVIPYAGKTPPQNWMLCQGQELPISDYEDIFNVLGNRFGGDGVNTFALPNLCERVAIHAGQGAQLQKYTVGATGGNAKVMLTTNHLPAHTHALQGTFTAQPICFPGIGTTSIPTNNYPATINGGAAQYSTTPGDNVVMGTISISAPTQPAPVGEQKEAVYTMSPFLTMNYIICVKGLFPSHQ